jgi:hypothetical protein
LMSIALVSAARGEDRALLIGVGRYAHFDERLSGVRLDLDMMSEMAQLMGFRKQAIKVLEDEQASTARVYAVFEDWLIKGTGPRDRVLFYFSGHGSQVPDENNDETDQFDEVLLLYDAALSEVHGRPTLGGVLHDDNFGRMLAKIKSRNMLIILDACHSGSATRSLQLVPRTIPIKDARVKYLYYSPMLEAAGGSGRFDVMEPEMSPAAQSRYVAITACRDDEKTVATAQGSIFTLGLRAAVRAAAMTAKSITPEELQRQATQFIQEQIGSDEAVFHPQIAGFKTLRQRPLPLVALAGGNGVVRRNLEALVHKSYKSVGLNLNKTCFEPGDVLELSIRITESGYLNVVSITADDRATVLFPNPYQPNNAVTPGQLILPSAQMNFEMVTDGPPGPALVTAFLTRSPMDGYKNGFKAPTAVLAELSPNSTRSLMMRKKEDRLAAAKVSVEIREEGRCK